MAIRYKHKGPRPRTFIAQWRAHAGLNKRELAERLDISEATLSRYESGKIPITLDFLADCADELGCDIADLVSRGPDESAAEAMARAILKRAGGNHHR